MKNGNEMKQYFWWVAIYAAVQTAVMTLISYRTISSVSQEAFLAMQMVGCTLRFIPGLFLGGFEFGLKPPSLSESIVKAWRIELRRDWLWRNRNVVLWADVVLMAGLAVFMFLADQNDPKTLVWRWVLAGAFSAATGAIMQQVSAMAIDCVAKENDAACVTIKCHEGTFIPAGEIAGHLIGFTLFGLLKLDVPLAWVYVALPMALFIMTRKEVKWYSNM